MSKKYGKRCLRIKPEIAQEMGLTLNPSNRYRTTKEQEDLFFKLTAKLKKEKKKNEFFQPDVEDNDFGNESTTETNQYTEPQMSSVLSARNADGTIMTPDVYCVTYGLDPADIKSYKLITHTGIPYYNIASQSRPSLKPEEEFDMVKKIEDLIASVPKKTSSLPPIQVPSSIILQLVISDTHIGMDANQNGISLYGGNWSKKDLFERRDVILSNMGQIFSSVGYKVDCVQVLNLGDFADGLDGQTVRKGHELPQNMNNEEVFDTGVEFLRSILDYIVATIGFNKMIWYNVCNSNHSSSFDYFICQAFKGIAKAQYSQNIEVINQRKFIGHFTYGSHTEIICHGKDDVSMKFGFKAQLDQKGKEKIDGYIKFHKLLTLGTFIHFHKGDSHQFVIDKSEDYDFTSYLALSPASGWVQVNFKSGRSGFSVIVKDKDAYGNMRRDFEFDWETNKLR